MTTDSVELKHKNMLYQCSAMHDRPKQCCKEKIYGTGENSCGGTVKPNRVLDSNLFKRFNNIKKCVPKIIFVK